MSKNGTVLELEDVTFHRSRRRILQGISWRIERGQKWAILGANGSGKTTLLQVAMGYLWPTGGAVKVLGCRYGEVDLRRLRRKIGYVSSSLQAMVRADQTAMQVTLSGVFATAGLFDRPEARHRKRAKELLELIGCGHVCDGRFATLSLGEQQKVLIARAMMARPALLILDEPCAGLDIRSRESLLEGLDRHAGNGSDGMSLVLVTHHIEEIPPAITHVMLLKDGRTIAQGPKRRVLSGKELSRAFDLPIEVEEKYGRYWPRVGRKIVPLSFTTTTKTDYHKEHKESSK